MTYMGSWIYALCCFFLSLGVFHPEGLFARLEDHFKAAPNKGEGHRIQNVDFIYMINLDERPEKVASSLSKLQAYGITPYRFSAVNGWNLSPEEINDLGVMYEEKMRTDLMGTSFPLTGEGPLHEKMSVPGRVYFLHGMTKGAIGIVLSHLSILQDALNSGYKTVWIMEDDVLAMQDPKKLSGLIEALDESVGKDNWDILFTDRDTISNETGQYVPCLGYAERPNFTPKNPERFTKKADVGSDFCLIGARYGMYSYIIRRSGMKKILNFIKKYKVFLPIDMEFYLPLSMRCYTVQRDVVSTQRFAPTDNAFPGYQNKSSN